MFVGSLAGSAVTLRWGARVSMTATKRAPRPGEGRPSKYRPEFIASVDEYLAQCVDEETEFHKTRGDKSDSYDRILKVNLPMIEGFSKFLDVDVTTIYEWAKVYPEFSHALEHIKEEQKNRLLNEGLAGTYNPMIAKLILSANHDMKEKSDVTSDGKPIMGNTINIRNYKNGAGH